MTLSYYEYITAAKVNFSEGREVESWHNLFEAELILEESVQKPRTQSPRQIEQKKLYRLLGQIHREIVNLENLQGFYKDSETKSALNYAAFMLRQSLPSIKSRMSTIKQRIPK